MAQQAPSVDLLRRASPTPPLGLGASAELGNLGAHPVIAWSLFTKSWARTCFLFECCNLHNLAGEALPRAAELAHNVVTARRSPHSCRPEPCAMVTDIGTKPCPL